MLKTTAAAVLILTSCLSSQAPAASISKSYSYFSIGGSTLDEIEEELARRGPIVKSTGGRHPGATRMQFTTKIGYSGGTGRCRIAQANVSVKAKVILPKWRRSRKADADVRLIWDTLASDIKRHEESHVIIAKNHGRELEKALLAIRPQSNCSAAAERAKQVTQTVLARHDKAQDRFDRIESANFESRMLRLLRHRVERDASRKTD